MTLSRQAWVFAIAVGCIIPDREISVNLGDDLPNEHAVRILERTPISEDMLEICNSDDRAEVDLRFCPTVRQSLRSGLVQDNAGPFCVCASADDNRAIDTFTVYAEDGDLDGDAPRDTLYGVFLLDPDPLDEEPRDAVAFVRYWANCRAGEVIGIEDGDEMSGRTAPSEARDPATLWAFRIDDASGSVDLCNGNGDPLDPGVHNLQFMVTDRPFFEAPFSGDSELAGGILHCGVPDLAAGATFAVINYVFECIDESDGDDPRSAQCDCAPSF